MTAALLLGRLRRRLRSPNLAAAIAFVAVAALARQCSIYADVWTDGVALWENALRVQAGRPAFLRGGQTTHAMAEYGMQLSWAGRQEEAIVALEKQVVASEWEMYNATHWASGRMSAAGYAPLSLVYRMVGHFQKSIAIADRGINFLAEAGMRSAAAGVSQHELDVLVNEAARLVAARSLAVFVNNPRLGVEQMEVALEMARDDKVVLSLSRQLSSFIEQVRNIH